MSDQLDLFEHTTSVLRVPDAYPDSMTLGAAREKVLKEMASGVDCPVCGRYVRIYRRKLNSGMAFALLTFFKVAGRQFALKPDVLRGVGAAARDESFLRFWGLFEEEQTVRRDDGGRAGVWRVTPQGEQFVRGRIKVPTYAITYRAECLGFDGPPVSIRQALGAKFNYDELMAGV